jgi:hypothetical protein
VQMCRIAIAWQYADEKLRRARFLLQSQSRHGVIGFQALKGQERACPEFCVRGIA